MIIFLATCLDTPFVTMELGCGQVFPNAQRTAHYDGRPVALLDMLLCSGCAADRYRRLRSIPCSASAPSAGPHDHWLFLGNSLGEYAVSCIWKRMLLHLKEDLWHAMFFHDETNAGSKLQAGGHVGIFLTSYDPFVQSSDARFTKNNRRNDSCQTLKSFSEESEETGSSESVAHGRHHAAIESRLANGKIERRICVPTGIDYSA
jgi:hypothetical protein